MISSKCKFLKNAPLALLGAFFMSALCNADDTKKTLSEPTITETDVTPTTPAEVAPEIKPEAEAPKSIRFMAYNLKNYLTMDVYLKGGVREPRFKASEEIDALVEIIVAEKPQILGLCEIGTKEDLAHLQNKLKEAGLDLPHSIHAGGFDKTRKLGLLSALPIAQNNSEDELIFEINNRQRTMGRGILSVVIDLPNGPTHFIGLHLKSKRPIRDFDEAEIRLNEARLAKEHCNAILAKAPNARLVVYGDMNDTRKTPPLSALMGRSNSKNYLGDVFLKDSRQELWTHFWSYQQSYSRFDYVLVSNSIKDEVDMENSHITDLPNWNEASDHRPLLVTFGK